MTYHHARSPTDENSAEGSDPPTMLDVMFQRELQYSPTSHQSSCWVPFIETLSGVQGLLVYLTLSMSLIIT
jgi:hypothetical protein